jgi:hypothetical protein
MAWNCMWTKFEVFVVRKMHIMVSCVVMPCSDVVRWQCFRGPLCKEAAGFSKVCIIPCHYLMSTRKTMEVRTWWSSLMLPSSNYWLRRFKKSSYSTLVLLFQWPVFCTDWWSFHGLIDVIVSFFMEDFEEVAPYKPTCWLMDDTFVI